MKAHYLVVVLILFAVQLVYSDTPYWVYTEDDPFLSDRANLNEFTLSYYSIDIKFQQEKERLIFTKRFVIDAAGNIVEKTEADYTDSTTLMIQYLYDASNRLLEERVVISNSLYVISAEYEYNGNTRIEKRYSADGLWSQQKELFDEQGRELESTEYSADGAVISSFHYKYEKDRTTVDVYDTNGKLTSKSITYLLNEKAIKREDFYNGNVYRTISYEYGKLGQLIAEVGRDASGKKSVNIQYDYSNGKITQRRLTGSDGVEHLTEYEYDDQGRLMKISSKTKVIKFGNEYYETEYIIARTKVE